MLHPALWQLHSYERLVFGLAFIPAFKALIHEGMDFSIVILFTGMDHPVVKWVGFEPTRPHPCKPDPILPTTQVRQDLADWAQIPLVVGQFCLWLAHFQLHGRAPL